MTEKRDYYEVLGIDRTASGRDISNAYRKLALKYHPDSNPGDEAATERFKEAAEAYEVLNDSEKRALYDQHGHAGLEGRLPQFSGVEDLFEVFEDFFGGSGRRGRRQRRGADLKCNVTLTLEEAARGVTKTVELKRSKLCEQCRGDGAMPGTSRETCRECGGRGQAEIVLGGFVRMNTTCQACRGAGSRITHPCNGCRGSGYQAERVRLNVAVPAGVDNGMAVPLKGQGEPSPVGGQPGDCYCHISVRPHSLFQRKGSDLILQLPITYTQAALGTSIEVPTLNGTQSLDLPNGTHHGQVFPLRGQGMPDPHGGGGVGDLLVQTFLEVPKRVSPQQEALLRELAELEHTDVTPHRKSFLEKLKEYFAPADESVGERE